MILVSVIWEVTQYEKIHNKINLHHNDPKHTPWPTEIQGLHSRSSLFFHRGGHNVHISIHGNWYNIWYFEHNFPGLAHRGWPSLAISLALSLSCYKDPAISIPPPHSPELSSPMSLCLIVLSKCHLRVDCQKLWLESPTFLPPLLKKAGEVGGGRPLLSFQMNLLIFFFDIRTAPTITIATTRIYKLSLASCHKFLLMWFLSTFKCCRLGYSGLHFKLDPFSMLEPEPSNVTRATGIYMYINLKLNVIQLIMQ